MAFPISVGIRILIVEYREQLDWSFPQLSAPYWRLYWNVSGAASLVVDDGSTRERVRLRPETAYLIPPDTRFGSLVDGPIDHFYVHFTLEDREKEPVTGVYELPGSPTMQNGLRRIIGDRRTNAEHTDAFAASGLVFASLSLLPPHAWRPASPDPLVRRVEHLARAAGDLDLEAVAAEFDCSERTLRRRFLEAYHVTPQQYAMAKRIDNACVLLHFSNLSIGEIADECGFSDRYYFTRTFARLRGMGPAAFRDVVQALAR